MKKLVKVWDFPEELVWLQEEPRVIRRWTPEEAALAAISRELQRQHELLIKLVDVFAVEDDPRGVEVSEGGG